MITFNGVDLSTFVRITDIKRDITPPKELTTQNVPGMRGIYLSGSTMKERYVEVSIMFLEKKLEELRKKVREFSNIINTDEPKKIVFHDEPDVYYYAILTGESNLQETLAVGTATITFMIPDPIAWGADKEAEFIAFLNEPTFSRKSSARSPLSNTLVPANVPRYETVSSKKGIFIEEPTTNLIPSPTSLEGYTFKVYNLENASTISGGVANVSFVRDGSVNGDVRLISPEFTVSKSERHMFSFDMIKTSGKIELYASGLAVDDFADSEKPIGEISEDGVFSGYYGTKLVSAITLNDGFTRYTLQLPSGFFTAGSGDTVSLIHKHGWSSISTVNYKFRQPQFEIKNKYPTSFVDGTRDNESLFVPVGLNISSLEGSLELRFHVDDNLLASTDSKRYLFSVLAGNDSSSALSLYTLSGTFKLSIGSVGYTVTPVSGWNDIQLTWNDKSFIAVLNGVVVLELTSNSMGALGTSIYIGSNKGTEQANTYYDCFRLSNKSKTKEELISSYNTTWSVEEGTTSLLMKFDGNLQVESSDYTNNNTINVSGTYPSSPIITITAKSSSPEFKITLNSDKFLRMKYSVKNNDVIVIDCNKNLVTLNGERALEYLDIYSTFFDLEPGPNKIIFTEGLTVSVNIQYKERWS